MSLFLSLYLPLLSVPPYLSSLPPYLSLPYIASPLPPPPSLIPPLPLQSSEKQEAQTQYTYVCDETLDPTFLGQKFLFSVNEKAALEPRQYRIRVVVKTKENLRVSRFLGMADIHLTCLKNEQEIEVTLCCCSSDRLRCSFECISYCNFFPFFFSTLSPSFFILLVHPSPLPSPLPSPHLPSSPPQGWFPLRPQRGGLFASSAREVDVSGSVRLRLRWIHSGPGLSHPTPILPHLSHLVSNWPAPSLPVIHHPYPSLTVLHCPYLSYPFSKCLTTSLSVLSLLYLSPNPYSSHTI